MLHLRADLKLVAHSIMGHGENASSPTKKVKVSSQPTVQQQHREKCVHSGRNAAQVCCRIIVFLTNFEQRYQWQF